MVLNIVLKRDDRLIEMGSATDAIYSTLGRGTSEWEPTKDDFTTPLWADRGRGHMAFVLQMTSTWGDNFSQAFFLGVLAPVRRDDSAPSQSKLESGHANGINGRSD